MSFTRLVLKNLFRQRARTFLTVLGISLGIMTVVALGVVTAGLTTMAGDIAHAGGADFIVGQKGSADLSFSTVPEAELEELQQQPGVESATGLLMVIRRIASNPYFALIGVDPAGLPKIEPGLVDGRVIAAGAMDEAMIGTSAASDLELGVGDTLAVDEHEFTIVGTYTSGILWQDKGAILPLRPLQELSGRAGVVTIALVHVAPGASVADVAARIERDQPALVTVQSEAEFGELDQGLQMMDAANMAISFLAVGIGAIGVMNTMGMAVFERTREIGVLRAVGWNGPRVLRMILTESLVLCMVAVMVGSALGVLASQSALSFTSIGGLLEPVYEPMTFVRAIGVAVAVALAGAAYPSYRALRLTPMEALRHE